MLFLRKKVSYNSNFLIIRPITKAVVLVIRNGGVDESYSGRLSG